ncbi:MAG: hypothetical protein ABIP06_08370 [Pyrinomonadaceae bacterium]
MRISNLFVGNGKSFVRFSLAFSLIFLIVFSSFAQYKGKPVKKELLLKVLRSKQLQTEDIVTVIRTNGVDFHLTDEVRKDLIAAGARPQVLNAVSENQRASTETFAAIKPAPKPVEPNYDELLTQAIFSFKDQKNPTTAVQYLETALKLRPKDPKAYQMLGFVNLYGLYNLTEAQKYMRESIVNGGSAVFRVFHDDNGDFTHRCSGSLFISPEKIRFESDDNIHTFETSTVNVEKIKLDKESSKIWNNHTIFKVFLKIGNMEAKFRFAPITNNVQESQMVAQFVAESQKNNFSTGLAMISR